MNYKQAFAVGLIAPGEMGKEPVAWLYNGVRLPGLPSVEGHPYRFIEMDTIIGTVTPVLCLCQPLPYVGIATSGERFLYVFGSYKRFILTGEHTTWQLYTEGTYHNTIPEDVIWASFDIYDENGGLMLAASDPIPVYE